MADEFFLACFIVFVFPVELPEAEKLALSLCCHRDRPSVWKTIYFECLSSGKHFLEQVLVSLSLSKQIPPQLKCLSLARRFVKLHVCSFKLDPEGQVRLVCSHMWGKFTNVTQTASCCRSLPWT